MAEIRILHRLRDIARQEWNACFPGELEDYDYLLATEEAGISGFAWRYVIASQLGVVCAAMPFFLTDYALDTTLDGTAKKITTALRATWPRALTLKLACLGSPTTDAGKIGFHPSLGDEKKSALLQDMLAAFEAHAVTQGYRLLGLKDIPTVDYALLDAVSEPLGYRAVTGLPVAHLPIDFADFDAYLATLSASTRKDMRRKLKAREGLRIEERTNIDDVLPSVIELYRQTRARADMQFEDLTPSFFHDVLTGMPGRALCMLYFDGDRLLAMNLLLRDGTTLLDKYFCMASEEGRARNLYFLSWMTNIDYCLKHGLKRYQSGQAGYENKLRLGSQLTATRMYFRHTNPWVQGVLNLVAPFLAADDTNKEAA